MQTCIVVPFYKQDLSNDEKFSFRKLSKYLNNYDIYIIYPKWKQKYTLKKIIKEMNLEKSF